MLTSKSYAVCGNYSVSWFVVIKPKAKENFARSPSYYFGMYKNTILRGVAYFPRSIIISVAVQYPPSHAFAILLLVVVGNRRICRWGPLQWNNILTRSRGNWSPGSNLKWGTPHTTHTHTHTHTQRSKWCLINLLSSPCRNVVRLNVIIKTLQLKPPRLY